MDMSRSIWQELVDPADEKSFPRAGSEELLRKFCQYSVEASPAVEPLRSVTIVGGLFLDFDDVRNRLTNRDAYYLVHGIQYLLRSGIPVAPDFTVHLANFLHGEDYLQTAYSSDLVMLGFMPRYTREDFARDSGKLEYFKGHGFALHHPREVDQYVMRQAFQRAVSERNFVRADEIAQNHGGIISPLSSPENWRSRLSLAAPKMVISFHGYGEELEIAGLGLNSLVEPIVDQTKQLIRPDKIVAGEAEFRKPELVSRGWKIFVDQEYLEAAAPSLWNFTMLGQHMRATVGLGERPAIIDPERCLQDGMTWMPRPPYRVPERRSSPFETFLLKHWQDTPRPWQPT